MSTILVWLLISVSTADGAQHYFEAHCIQADIIK